MRDRGQHADAERNQLKRRNNMKRAAAANGRVAVRQPKIVAIPNAEATLITSVIAISTGEKCPDRTRDQPSKKARSTP